MDNLEDLQEALNKHCQRWLARAFSTQDIDRTELPSALRTLYKILGKEEPLIVYADSPWQIAAMKAALECGLDEKAAREFEHLPQLPQIFARELQDENVLFARLWRRLDRQLDASTRAKLHTASERERAATRERWTQLPFFNSDRGRNKEQHGTWSRLVSQLTVLRTSTTNQLHGVAASFFQGNQDFEALRSQYERAFPLTRQDDLAVALRTTLITQLTTSFLFVWSPEEAVFTADKIASRLLAYIAGDKEQLRLVPKDRQLQFDFAMATFVAATDLVLSTSVLGWLPFYDFVLKHLPGLPLGPKNQRVMQALLDICKYSPAILFFEGICFVCEAPLLFSVDEAARLHAEDGPALAFGDSYRIYAWHGTMVPSEIIEAPSKITVAQILAQPNSELRRVMIDRFGAERFIRESGATIVHEDAYGSLYRQELQNDEALVMVRVKNSSPEPDGTYRDYFLRVPPTMRTAKAAVAWTFNMSPEEYSPSRES